MKILVDSSVWIDYFKQGERSAKLDQFIEQNLICINDLILTELVPSLRLKRQEPVIELLQKVANIPLSVSWHRIIDYQVTFLQKGLNQIGIPDLIIFDQAVQCDLALYTLDKHFFLMNEHIPIKLV